MNSPITDPCEEASEKDSTVSGVSRKNTIVSEVDGNSEKVAPDGGWGWWVVLGSTFAQLILAGCEKSRGVIYPVLLERFGANSAVTAWVISMTGVLRLCGGPVSSILSNRFGIRAVVMVGSVLICSGFFASSFAHNITAMFFTYGILAGIGQLCVYAPTVIIVGLYFDKRRALAAGLSSAGVGIGTFIIPPCVELCLEHFGYTNTFIILAGVALNLAVCGSLYRPLHIQWKIITKDKCRKKKVEELRKETSTEDEDSVQVLLDRKSNNRLKEEDQSVEVVMSCSDNANGDKDPDKMQKISFLSKVPCCSKQSSEDRKKIKVFEFSLLKDFPFLSFCLTLMLLTMAVQTGQVFIATFARERGVSKTNSALLLSIMGGCDTIGRVGSGLIFDTPKIKPNRQYIYNVFLFIIGLVCCLFPFAYNFTTFAVIRACFGFFSGTYIAQKSVIIVDLVGADKLVYSFGMIICFQGIGFLIGPTLSGVSVDYFKRYDLSFFFAGAITLIAGFVFLSGNIYAYRRKRRQS